MRFSRILRYFLVFFSVWGLASGLSPAPLFGQASVNVPVSDPVYRDIDKLVAHGLVDKIIMGQRPFSRREVARIVKEAMVHLSRIEAPLQSADTAPEQKEKLQARLDYLAPIMARLKREYREELIQWGALEGETKWYSLHPIDKVEAGVAVAASPAEALPVSNGIGEIDAVINPLLDDRQGRHLVNGSNLWLETSHWLRASDHFAMYLRPRFQLGIGRPGTPDENRVDILNLYGKFWVKNLEIEIGRDNFFYGQAANAGLLLSNNPRGLDFAKISNDSPFIFPWVFKYLGAHKISFFYADLGPQQRFPHSYLAGYKWSLQPLSFFELGASLVTLSGGEGSPPNSFGNRVEDLFPVVNRAFNEASNRMGGVDGRFRIPPLRGAEIYFEAIWDDTPGLNYRDLWQDVGYQFGLYLPRLTNSGNVDFRFDYQRTGVRFYRHGQFTSGWTLNRFIMGNDLGPNAFGLYATARWDINPQNLLSFQAAFENRSSDIWAIDTVVINGKTNLVGDFFKVVDNPDERRYRLVSEWQHRLLNDAMLLRLRAGYERATAFNFVAGNDRNNFLGEVSVQLDLDRWTRFPR